MGFKIKIRTWLISITRGCTLNDSIPIVKSLTERDGKYPEVCHQVDLSRFTSEALNCCRCI
jgi:hypothetical protein